MTVCCTLIRDRNRELIVQTNSEQTIQLFAALSSDPDSIEELAIGSCRFAREDWGPHWIESLQSSEQSNIVETHYVIDLPGRLIAYDASYPEPPRAAHTMADWKNPDDGSVADKLRQPVFAARYHLSSEWMIRRLWSRWRDEAMKRREKRDQWDRATRQFLDDSLCSDIAAEIQFELAAQSDRQPEIRGIKVPKLPSISRASREMLTERILESPVLRIHARWLLRDRTELHGSTIRDALIRDIEHIDFDLSHREEQWIVTGTQPPSISKNAHAYRYGGIGPGEFYARFRLIEALISEGLKRIEQATDPTVAIEELAIDLERYRESWFCAKQEREFAGFSAEEIVDLERRRVPLTMPEHDSDDACHCPLCELTVDENSITFWRVDEGWTPPDFVFSHFNHRDEWIELCEWNGVDESDPLAAEEIYYRTGQGFTVSVCRDVANPTSRTPFLLLFDFGAKLGELMESIERSPKVELCAEKWMNHFRELRTIMNEDEGLVSMAASTRALEHDLNEVQAKEAGLAEDCDRVRESLAALQEARELPARSSLN